MEVTEVKGDSALVDLNGLKKEVRLEIVDNIPSVGDFVIVHAGFALHTLTKEEAEESIRLFKDMARTYSDV
jgi:hydrogenase expression/formation protein HypC